MRSPITKASWVIRPACGRVERELAIGEAALVGGQPIRLGGGPGLFGRDLRFAVAPTGDGLAAQRLHPAPLLFGKPQSRLGTGHLDARQRRQRRAGKDPHRRVSRGA
jgi:hypothetical protein